MKVLVLGSTGIIGQHLKLDVPEHVIPFFARRSDCDLNNAIDAGEMLRFFNPDVVVNLAGQSNTDAVEQDPGASEWINAGFPEWLATWSRSHHCRVIQISSQAVFSGEYPPYDSERAGKPINEYGRQKLRAEKCVLKSAFCAKIIRPTFVLGVRPDPTIGRMNPVEQILSGQTHQVNDRWFSPAFAPDVASCIWNEVITPSSHRIMHVGVPVQTCRYEIAQALGVNVQPVSHADFPGIAPRPKNTTYAKGSYYRMTFNEGIIDCLKRWHVREAVAA